MKANDVESMKQFFERGGQSSLSLVLSPDENEVGSINLCEALIRFSCPQFLREYIFHMKLMQQAFEVQLLLLEAIQRNKIELVQVLLDAGASKQTRDGETTYSPCLSNWKP